MEGCGKREDVRRGSCYKTKCHQDAKGEIMGQLGEGEPLVFTVLRAGKIVTLSTSK